jgi:hypothetical protein
MATLLRPIFLFLLTIFLKTLFFGKLIVHTITGCGQISQFKSRLNKTDLDRDRLGIRWARLPTNICQKNVTKCLERQSFLSKKFKTCLCCRAPCSSSRIVRLLPPMPLTPPLLLVCSSCSV